MEADVSDVSNKTIVVLVVLTVIISVLSTLVVLNEVQNLNVKPGAISENHAQNAGKVSLTILPQKEPAMESSTGKVTLEIKPRK